MSTPIKDGTGTGILAKVDESHRLLSFATTQTGFISAVRKGAAFQISSSVFNLTDANESAVAYIKSLEDSDLVIHEISVQIGVSTGGTGDVIRRDYVGPTTGTLITEATPGLVGNLNAGSSDTLAADVFIGGQGKTVGGALFNDETIHHLESTIFMGSGLTITKGDSLGVSIQPPTGNTSLNVQVVITIYKLDSE